MEEMLENLPDEFKKEWEEEKKRRRMEADSRAYFEEEAQVLDLERLMYEAIGEQCVKYRPEDYSLEHRELVRAFIGQKITPFEDNHDLLKDYELDTQKIKQEWQEFKEQKEMLMPDATPEVTEEKIFTSTELSAKEKAELAKIEMAERVAKFKEDFNKNFPEKFVETFKDGLKIHSPCRNVSKYRETADKDGRYILEDSRYFTNINALILAESVMRNYGFREGVSVFSECGESRNPNKLITGILELEETEESKKTRRADAMDFDNVINCVELNHFSGMDSLVNPREDFKLEKIINEVLPQFNMALNNGDKIDCIEIIHCAEMNAVKLCYEADAEKQKRLDAIQNIDLNAKPKNNAEKLQRFCKKSMEARGEEYKNYVADGVKSFLLTTPSVKLEQMTRLIDYVAPDAVYNSQVNTYSEVVKRAVREDSVFRDRLKIARAKSNGVSR